MQPAGSPLAADDRLERIEAILEALERERLTLRPGSEEAAANRLALDYWRSQRDRLRAGLSSNSVRSNG
jgi:hypothetical protein